MNPTLYDVLGVSPDAHRDEIKKAWRDAADRFEPGSGGSSAQFRLFNEAAEVLLDPARRKEYDAQLAADVARSTAATEATADRDAEKEESPPPSPPHEDKTRDVAGSSSGRGIPEWALGGLALLTALAIVTVLAMAAAIYLFTDYQRASAYEDALDQAPSAAERAAVAILSFDYESLDSDRDAATRFLTSGYSDEYRKTFAFMRGSATETRAKVEAEVLASSSMLQSGDESPDRIPVLLFVDQTTVSTANSGDPTRALNRVRFDMVKVDGTWLVDHITSY